jgi:hypothetical protein
MDWHPIKFSKYFIGPYIVWSSGYHTSDWLIEHIKRISLVDGRLMVAVVPIDTESQIIEEKKFPIKFHFGWTFSPDKFWTLFDALHGNEVRWSTCAVIINKFPVIKFTYFTLWFTSSIRREIFPEYCVIDMSSSIKFQGRLKCESCNKVTW